MKRGIESLRKRKELVIRPADKGGGVVLQSKEKYMAEIDRQLGDGNTYQQLRSNPTSTNKKELEKLIHLGTKKGILNKKEAKYLIPESCRIPVLYTVPKIHKDKENPPGRPIVNGIDSLTARMGQYVDTFLQPAVQLTTAYLKDTKHLLQILQDTPVSEGHTLLATADVSSLYTIIKHHQACEATKWVLKRHSPLLCAQRKFLIKCVDFCLKNNYFWHNQKYYKQLTGVAMGAKFAPSVANAFMAQWEDSSVHTNTPPQLMLYKRYIDDLIIIWNGDRTTLEEFLDQLNTNDRNIALQWNIHEQHIDFLDLDIRIEGEKILTKTHFKSVDRNSYLSTNSCHFKHWLYNIPKGQLIRIKRNCTIEEDYKDQAHILKERFMKKGYSEMSLNNQINEVNHLSRNRMLETTTKRQTAFPEVPQIILDFNAQHKEVEKLFKKHWHILKADKHLNAVLPEKPKFIYKRAPTIRDKVVKNVIEPPPRNLFTFFSGTGFYPCKHCYACNHAQKQRKTDFQATTTGQTFTIKDFIGCNTEGVIYVLQCTCKLQYVGRTKRALKTRVKEHIRNIIKGYPKHSVSKHFLNTHNKDPSQLQFWGIEKYKKSWRGEHKIRTISQKESRWIYTLKTLTPRGMNVEFDLNCFLSNF